MFIIIDFAIPFSLWPQIKYEITNFYLNDLSISKTSKKQSFKSTSRQKSCTIFIIVLYFLMKETRYFSSFIMNMRYLKSQISNSSIKEPTRSKYSKRSTIWRIKSTYLHINEFISLYQSFNSNLRSKTKIFIVTQFDLIIRQR